MIVEIEKHMDGQIVELRLAAPPANIVSEQMIDALRIALREAAQTNEAKLLMISGKGDHFSYGASVEEHVRSRVGSMLPQFHALVRELIEVPVPTLACVTGRCFGGGFELALACSLIFVDETIAAGVPEIKLGVFPPVAAALLGSLTTSCRAAEMVLTGKVYNSTSLLDAGLINQVVPAGRVHEAALEFARTHFAPLSAASLRQAHRAVRSNVAARFREGIAQLEKQYLVDLMATADANEGIASFIEKRPPVWRNA